MPPTTHAARSVVAQVKDLWQRSDVFTVLTLGRVRNLEMGEASGHVVHRSWLV